jgi:maleate isomerase
MSLDRTLSSWPAGAAAREYGRAGLFGVLTPQSNPVAETELRILLSPAAVLLAARLRSSAASLEHRLRDYALRLGGSLDEFGDLELDAVGVACTGLSYSSDVAADRALIEGLAARKGYPVVTAAAAVESAIALTGMTSIALVSPYPPWLTESCRAHWERRGLRVSATLQLPPASGAGHGIYEITSALVLEALADFDIRDAQGILLAGTGMPSLRVIRVLQTSRPVPVLSSNLCLAWALARVTGGGGPGPESPLYGGWATRLELA